MLSSLPFPVINATLFLAVMSLFTLAACGRSQDKAVQYINAATTLVDNEIVQIDVVASGRDVSQALPKYADCVAAQYTLIRGLSYLRRVSGSQRGTGNLLSETTLYKLSDSKPAGASVIVAQDTVANCKSEDIPTF